MMRPPWLGGGFAKANILIYVGLRSAPPNLRLERLIPFSISHGVGWAIALPFSSLQDALRVRLNEGDVYDGLRRSCGRSWTRYRYAQSKELSVKNSQYIFRFLA
ncbi:MAG: hypothetical protein V7L26_00935 [Nostoc sp.]